MECFFFVLQAFFLRSNRFPTYQERVVVFIDY